MDRWLKADQIVQSIGFEQRGSVEELVQAIASHTGYTIEVVPIGYRAWGALKGMLLVEGTQARVLTRRTDPRWYQLFVLLHELAHLLLGHRGCVSLRSVTGAQDGNYVRDRSEDDADALAHRLSEMLLAPQLALDEMAFA